MVAPDGREEHRLGSGKVRANDPDPIIGSGKVRASDTDFVLGSGKVRATSLSYELVFKDGEEGRTVCASHDVPLATAMTAFLQHSFSA